MKATRYITIASFFLLLAFTGCKKDDDVLTGSIEDDASESIGSSLAADNDGTFNQTTDAYDAADGRIVSNGNFSKLTDTTNYKTKVYSDGWWTITIERELGTPSDVVYSYTKRTFALQFLNKNNQPQQYWRNLVEGMVDTATTINYRIINGSGYFKNPKVSHHLDSLSGEWVLTNTNTDTITVTGKYYRAGTDTVKTLQALRTMKTALNLTEINLKGPRKKPMDDMGRPILRPYKGTMKGTFIADVTFSKGELYKEKHIEKDINITVDGGDAKFLLGNKNFIKKLKDGQ